MLKRLKKHINENFKNIEGKKINLGVSGGVDSIVLLDLMSKLNLDLTICHCNFNLREEDSNKDEAFVKELAFKYNVPFLSKEFDTKKYMADNKVSVQMAARELRFDWFKELIANNEIVALAHHKDDLYENFFIRLLRGSGLNGLISFKKKYSKLKINEKILIFRPLLNFSKNELIYISENTFGNYIKDPSNLDNKYLRVYVRNILNNFKFNKKNKNFDLTLLNLHKSNKALEHYIQKNIDQNVIKNEEKVIVNKNFFSEPDEVVFRSLNIVLNSFSEKAKLSRGSKIMNLIKNFKNSKDTYKTTLSGCILKKVSNTMIISREI